MLSKEEIRAIITVWCDYRALEWEHLHGPVVNEDYANTVCQCRKAIEAVCYAMGYAIGAGPKATDGFFLCKLEEVMDKRIRGSWFYGRTDT